THVTTPSLHDALPIYLEEIMNYNHISEETKLAIGDVVIVPDGEVVPQASAASSRPVERTTTVSAQVVATSGYYIRPTTGQKTQRSEEHTSELQSRENL